MNNPLLNAENVRWARIARRWTLTLVLLLIVNLTLVGVAGWGFGAARSLAQTDPTDQAADASVEVRSQTTPLETADRQPVTTNSEQPADSPGAAAIALAETPVVEPVVETPSPAAELTKTPEPTVDRSAAVPELPEANQPPQPAAAELVIVNPPTSGGIVHFLVDGDIVSLDAGEYCSLAGEQPREVVFHKGDEFENVTLSLTPGVFVFVVTEGGWQLQPADDEVEEMLCELCRQVE